jgi:putative ABC transport system permease protein
MTRPWFWTLRARRLTRSLSPQSAASTLGDLLEEYVAQYDDAGRLSAEWWLFRESRSLARAYWLESHPRRSILSRVDILRDVRFAARTLWQAPGITAAAVLTLALGVGLNTAIFSVVKSLLLNQLPYRDPDRLVALSVGDSTDTRPARVGSEIVDEWRRLALSFAGISAYDDAQLTLTDSGDAEVLRGTRVSQEFFDTLGVRMLLGRGFAAGEDRTPRANVIVLTHDLWSRRFAADPRVIGRTLRMDQGTYQVIGVLPADFQPLRMTNPAESPQFFAPADYEAGGAHRVIARLEPDVTTAQARAELTNILRDVVPDQSKAGLPTPPVHVEPLLDALVGPIREALWILMGAVAFVLLIACANTASLQLTRATGRAQEFALRTALGADRARLVSQLLIENVFLALVGGAAGVFVGWLGTSAIASLAPRELPRLNEIHVDGQVLLIALAVSVATGCLFGMAPAWAATRVDVNDVLKDTVGVAGRSSGARLRNALVIAQVALAFVLVMATLALGRSLQHLRAVEAGFDARGVLTLTPVLPARGRCNSAETRLECYRQLLDAVRTVPGVTATALISNVPFSHIEPGPLRLDRSGPGDDGERLADVFWVSPDYFRALAIPLKRGRLLTDQDGTTAPPAALVSESFAAAQFPGADAVGRRIQVLRGEEQTWLIIVGIVGDVRYDALNREARQAVYEPMAMNPFHYTRLVVRTDGDPRRIEGAVRAALRDSGTAQTVFHVQPMEDYIASSLADRRFALTLIAVFGVLALVLSAVGLYGVMSYAVLCRTSEIGMRAALGAGRGDVFGLILRQGMLLAGAGLALGLVAGLGAIRLLVSFLYGTGSTDLLTLGATAAVLAVAAALACYIPARAAMRIDPLAAIRGH